MSKRKVILQEDLGTQQQLDDFLAKPGLKVIDAYTEWCGPCKAVESLFRRLKTDINDDLLSFGLAKTDAMPKLKAFHGSAEPCFLFYGADVLVDVVRGADGPKLEKGIRGHLEAEHNAIDTGTPRVPFEGTGESLSRAQSARKRPSSGKAAAPSAAAASDEAPSSTAEPEVPAVEYTFALIKPDAVAGGHADAIFAKLAEAGFKVAQQDEITLTAERAQSFYAEHAGKDFFDNLITFMTSGPTKPLVLSAVDAVSAWRQLIGPTNTETAKEEAPDSLRALYGTDQTSNAVHGSDSAASAKREIDFFFTEWAQEHLDSEDAVLLVTPDIVGTEGATTVQSALADAHFTIAAQKEVSFTPDDLVTLLGSGIAEDLSTHLCSGPSLLLHVSRVEAQPHLATLVGPSDVDAAKSDAPDSLRARIATDNVKCGVIVPSDAAAAIDAFFVEHDPENEVTAEALNADAAASDEAAADAEASAEAEGETPAESAVTAEGEGSPNANTGDGAVSAASEAEGDANADREGEGEAAEHKPEDEEASAIDASADASDVVAGDGEGDQNAGAAGDSSPADNEGDTGDAGGNGSDDAPTENSQEGDQGATEGAAADEGSDTATGAAEETEPSAPAPAADATGDEAAVTAAEEAAVPPAEEAASNSEAQETGGEAPATDEGNAASEAETTPAAAEAETTPAAAEAPSS